MTPKRGQPPKPPEEQRNDKISLRFTKAERTILEEAYRLSGSPNTLARWLASTTLEEAERIITEHRN